MSYHILVPGKRATKTWPLIERRFTISCDNCIVNRFGFAVNTIIHIYEVSGESTAVGIKTTRCLWHRVAADYRGGCRRWLLTGFPSRKYRLTFMVFGDVRLGLHLQAIASPPSARYRKEADAKPKVILAKIPTAVNENSYQKEEIA